MFIDNLQAHFPIKFNAYFEPFVGGASVILNIKKNNKETINDLDPPIYNVLNVLKHDKSFEEFKKMAKWHIACRQLYLDAWRYVKNNSISEKDVMHAYSSFVLYNYSFGNFDCTQNFIPSFRISKTRSVPKSIINKICCLDDVHERLKDVTILNKDYVDVISTSKEGDFIYLDPPYKLETRKKGRYSKDLKDSDHDIFIEHMLELNKKGVFLLISGYNCKLYDLLLDGGFKRKDFAVKLNSAISKKEDGQVKADRIESLWYNFIPVCEIQNKITNYF